MGFSSLLISIAVFEKVFLQILCIIWELSIIDNCSWHSVQHIVARFSTLCSYDWFLIYFQLNFGRIWTEKFSAWPWIPKKTDPISSSSHGPAVYCSGPQQKKHRAAIRRIRIRLQSDSHLLFVAHGLTHSFSLGHVRLLSRSQPSLSALPDVMINVFGNKIFLLVSYPVRCKLCSVQWICFFLSLPA